MLTTTNVAWGAYNGAFPMGEDDGTVQFYLSNDRALFPIEGIRVSKRLAKTLRQGKFEVKFDTAFEDVMRACRRPSDNWINEPIIRAYCEAHAAGWAHCAESWCEDRLVGGVYGIGIGGCFMAESMFHQQTDASKVALHGLVNRCRAVGFRLFDAQVMNPHLASLGAYSLTHDEYMQAFIAVRDIKTPWSVLVSNNPYP